MTKNAQIRAYLAEHPGATAGEVRIGLDMLRAPQALALMVKRGLLRTEGPDGGRRYFVARACLKLRRSKDEMRILRTEKARERRHQNLAQGLTWSGKPRLRGVSRPKVKPHGLVDCAKRIRTEARAAIPAQSVDDYLAHGGRIEVLPTFAYTLPRLLPMNGARIGTRAA